MKEKKEASLNVGKILNEFKESEKLPSHRKGTFKLDAPFEEAVKSIIKAKPEPKLSRKTKSEK